MKEIDLDLLLYIGQKSVAHIAMSKIANISLTVFHVDNLMDAINHLLILCFFSSTGRPGWTINYWEVLYGGFVPK